MIHLGPPLGRVAENDPKPPPPASTPHAAALDIRAILAKLDLADPVDPPEESQPTADADVPTSSGAALTSPRLDVTLESVASSSSQDHSEHCSPPPSVPSAIDPTTPPTRQSRRASRRKRNQANRRRIAEEKLAFALQGDNSRYKTRLCAAWLSREACPAGEQCNDAHGYQELRSEHNNRTAVSSLLKLAQKASKNPQSASSTSPGDTLRRGSSSADQELPPPPSPSSNPTRSLVAAGQPMGTACPGSPPDRATAALPHSILPSVLPLPPFSLAHPLLAPAVLNPPLLPFAVPPAMMVPAGTLGPSLPAFPFHPFFLLSMLLPHRAPLGMPLAFDPMPGTAAAPPPFDPQGFPGGSPPPPR
eukprot:EG_transcript_2681